MSMGKKPNRANLRRYLNEFIATECNRRKCDCRVRLSKKKLMEFKSVLSDVNNIVTIEVSLAFVKWIEERNFIPSSYERERIVEGISNPNRNGYDIEISTGNKKMIAEVKCNMPIHGEKGYGSNQKTSIRADIRNLRNGKSKADKAKTPKIVKGYRKFMVFPNEKSVRKSTALLFKDDKGIVFYADKVKAFQKNKIYIVFV